jgi:hypothetical protein
MLASLLLPLFFFHSPGTTDYADWLRWFEVLRRDGWIEGYKEIAAMYPPFSEGALRVASLLSDTFNTTPFASIKLIILTAGYLSTGLFFWWRRSESLSLCLLWTTSGMMLGYLDILFVPAFVAALWSLERNRYGSGGFFYAVACFTKWQPLIVAPFLLVYAWKHKATLEFATPIVCMAGIMYLLFGNAIILDLRLSFEQNLLSGNALNLPLLIDGILRHFNLARLASCEPESPWDWLCLTRESVVAIYVLKAIFEGAYACILISFIRRHASFVDLLQATLIAMLAYFSLNPGVHENHLFLAAVLALVYLQERPEELWLCVFVIVTAVLNPILFYGLDGHGLPYVDIPHNGSVTPYLILLATIAASMTIVTGRSVVLSVADSFPCRLRRQ